MPLFSDTIDHGSTNGRYHACRIHRARFVTVDRNENLTQQSITGAYYDECLMRVDVSESVSVQLRDVWLGCWCHALRVTVVSRTLNRTCAINRKRKTSYAIAWEEFSIRRQLEMIRMEDRRLRFQRCRQRVCVRLRFLHELLLLEHRDERMDSLC